MKRKARFHMRVYTIGKGTSEVDDDRNLFKKVVK